MISEYAENIFLEKKNYFKKRSKQIIKVKGRKCKTKHRRKMYKYLFMAIGEFELAKNFNK